VWKKNDVEQRIGASGTSPNIQIKDPLVIEIK
jgi:hypothetical protein